jgi:hypothetical protein
MSTSDDGGDVYEAVCIDEIHPDGTFASTGRDDGKEGLVELDKCQRSGGGDAIAVMRDTSAFPVGIALLRIQGTTQGDPIAVRVVAIPSLVPPREHVIVLSRAVLSRLGYNCKCYQNGTPSSSSSSSSSLSSSSSSPSSCWPITVTPIPDMVSIRQVVPREVVVTRVANTHLTGLDIPAHIETRLLQRYFTTSRQVEVCGLLYIDYDPVLDWSPPPAVQQQDQLGADQSTPCVHLLEGQERILRIVYAIESVIVEDTQASASSASSASKAVIMAITDPVSTTIKLGPPTNAPQSTSKYRLPCLCSSSASRKSQAQSRLDNAAARAVYNHVSPCFSPPRSLGAAMKYRVMKSPILIETGCLSGTVTCLHLQTSYPHLSSSSDVYMVAYRTCVFCSVELTNCACVPVCNHQDAIKALTCATKHLGISLVPINPISLYNYPTVVHAAVVTSIPTQSLHVATADALMESILAQVPCVLYIEDIAANPTHGDAANIEVHQ